MARKQSSPQSAAQPTHEQIAERARQLWAERGNPAGRDLEHWLEAERQLRGDSDSGPRRTPANTDSDEAEKRLDGLIENKPSPARRTPAGEQL